MITELLYRPATNAFEFIELCNTASTNVPLYDPLHPTNTWKLEGGIEFTFPTGLSLAPGSFILITETNAAAFTKAYAVPAGVTVLGPYVGKLDNAGETVRITRPGEPEALTGEIPYILGELVDYENTAPWPTNANAGGVALVRVNTTLYANDPANWTSSANVTPGTAAGVDPDADADGDGMPDSWEIAYFGSTNAVNGGAGDDWDGDWESNYAEYLADTNPTNPLSRFHIESFTTEPSPAVRFTSSASRVYTLYYCTDLASGAWANIPSQTDIPGSGGVDTLTDPVPADPQRFYRLGISLP